jgi:hypothetical protein
MKLFRRFTLVCLALFALPATPAWGGHFAIGFNIGVPVFYRPYYPCYPYYGYYYRPYPVYFAPPPVVIQPTPVVQQDPVTQPVAQPVYPAPAPQPTTTYSPPANGNRPTIEAHLQRLSDANEQVRSESALQLGRLRAAEAIDPLAATLAGDSNPKVREAAARALGLIGSSKALPALQQASQVDSDPTVRHSAEFSIDVIHARG